MVYHKLTFTDHIYYILKKVAKRIGAMYRSKNLMPIKYRKMFANALMLPLFDYLDIIYNRAGKSKLKELDILYKKVAKIALGVSTRESSITVYIEIWNGCPYILGDNFIYQPTCLELSTTKAQQTS